MNERTKTSLEIIQVALVIGVIGDVFLRVTPWGVNVLCFNAVFTAGMFTLLWRRAPQYLTRQTYGLFAALLFFAAMFAWRDSIELRIADTFAILAVVAVLFLPRMKVTAQVAGVSHYIAGFVGSSLSALGAPLLLIFYDVEWTKIPNNGWRKHAFSAARGVAIAAPLILIFGALFVAADAAYEGLVQRVFNIKPEIVFTHLLLFSAFSWMTAGYLRGVFFNKDDFVETPGETPMGSATVATQPNESKFEHVRKESGEYPVTLPNNHSVTEHINASDEPELKTNAPESSEPSDSQDLSAAAAEPKVDEKARSWANFDNSVLPASFTLGAVEVSVILGLMNLLFLSFVIVQVPYLFGGMELVQNTPDFKLAEYARRGFGELVTVSALVLPILLLGHWLIRKESRAAANLFRILAGTQIVLLFVIMASAVQRLVLLTGSLGYGMTTIRLYPMIFMTWLAIVFVWFGFTVLRGSRQHFAWGALWSAFLVLGATQVLNPDAFIVRTNIALMEHGRPFDATYNSRLSDDALPALMESFDDLTSEDKKTVLMNVGERFCEKSEESDLRSWNFSRWYASRALNEKEKVFTTFGQCDSGRYSYPRYGDIP